MPSLASPERASAARALHVLHQLTEKTSAHVPLDELLAFVYEGFQGVLPFVRLGYALVDRERGRVIARWVKSERPLRLKAGYSAPLEGSSLAEILATNRPRVLADLREYLRLHPNSDATQLMVQEGMRSSLTCPLVVDGQAVGLLFFSSDRPHAYSAADVELFEEVAGHLAWLLERCHLADELRRAAEQTLTERERRAAAERRVEALEDPTTSAVALQSLLFPHTLPQQPGYGLAVHYQPTSEPGGGFVDVCPVADGRTAILLAEGSERGYRGLMQKTALHALWQGRDWRDASAAQVMGELHRALGHAFPHGTCAAGLVAILDPERGTVSWSDAAFPVPVLVKYAGYTADGVLEGPSPVSAFNFDCLPLEAGDKVFLHSPQLGQLRNAEGEEFGGQRLHDVLRRLARCAAAEMLDRVWQEVHTFLAGIAPPDDLLAVVVERSPANVRSLILPVASEFPWRTDWRCDRSAVTGW